MTQCGGISGPSGPIVGLSDGEGAPDAGNGALLPSGATGSSAKTHHRLERRSRLSRSPGVLCGELHEGHGVAPALAVGPPLHVEAHRAGVREQLLELALARKGLGHGAALRSRSAGGPALW